MGSRRTLSLLHAPLLLALGMAGCPGDTWLERTQPIAPLADGELRPPALLDRPDHCPGSTQRVSDENLNVCVHRFPLPGWNEHPTLLHTHEEAEEACRLIGMRLCHENEWELACRGRARSRYPYGDAYVSGRCVTGTAHPLPSGRRLDCRSDFGIHDTSGNVAEWTSEGLLKGGDATGGAFESRCTARINPAIDEMPSFPGARCCLDAHEPRGNDD